MSLFPSERARGVILDDDDTDDAVAFEPGVNIAALVFSKIQCVRTRAALARASKFWLHVSKQKEALPRRFYLPMCEHIFNSTKNVCDVARTKSVTGASLPTRTDLSSSPFSITTRLCLCQRKGSSSSCPG